jgi:hypothetical protein
LVREVGNVLRPILFGVLALVALFAVIGCLVTIFGHAGDTEIGLFGQHLKTRSVVVVAFFVGAIIVVPIFNKMANDNIKAAISGESGYEPTEEDIRAYKERKKKSGKY